MISLPGVYVLFHRDERVYVGKAERSLQGRLADHLAKLSGRQNIDLRDVTFVGLYVAEDLDAVAPETILIHTYQRAGSLPWNGNGFGINDPGRERDTSAFRIEHFDAQFPARLDAPIDLSDLGSTPTLYELLRHAKRLLPYTFRYATTAAASVLYRGRSVAVPASITAEGLMALVIGALPEDWQATALPGYLILYPEHRHFQSARCWWRLDGGHPKRYLP